MRVLPSSFSALHRAPFLPDASRLPAALAYRPVPRARHRVSLRAQAARGLEWAGLSQLAAALFVSVVAQFRVSW